jgi:hypothetical protein
MSLALESNGRFGNALAEALDSHNPPMSIRDLAAKTGGTYEHTRKLVRGIAYPSTLLLKEISKILKLDFEDMQKLVDADKMEKKFGSNAFAVFGHDPRIGEWQKILPHLTKEQHDSLLIQARALMKQNRQRRGA